MYAGYSNTGGSQTALGNNAGNGNSGSQVIGLGYHATYNNSGNDVVGIGYQAGYNNTVSNQFIVKQANINAVPLIQGDFLSGQSFFAGDIGTAMAIPASPTATLGVAGTLNGTYYYKVSASDGTGWTNVSTEVSGTVDSGTTNGTITIAWTASARSTNYRVWRGTAADGETEYYETTSTSLADDGSLTFTTATPPAVTTAYINKLTSSGDSWLLGGNFGVNTSAPDYVGHINGTFACAPGALSDPVNIGDITLEATSDTSITLKLKGSDGVIRSNTLTIA